MQKKCMVRGCKRNSHGSQLCSKHWKVFGNWHSKKPEPFWFSQVQLMPEESLQNYSEYSDYSEYSARKAGLVL